MSIVSIIYLLVDILSICFPFLFCNICINVIQSVILLISNSFSVHRITDNLLAMARPSAEIIEKFNIIEQFHMYVELSGKLPVSDSQDAPGTTLLMLILTSFQVWLKDGNQPAASRGARQLRQHSGARERFHLSPRGFHGGRE